MSSKNIFYYSSSYRLLLLIMQSIIKVVLYVSYLMIHVNADQMCNPFPKLIGGNLNHTGQTGLDYQEINGIESLVSVGATFDISISHGKSLSGYIAMYQG